MTAFEIVGVTLLAVVSLWFGLGMMAYSGLLRWIERDIRWLLRADWEERLAVLGGGAAVLALLVWGC